MKKTIRDVVREKILMVQDHCAEAIQQATGWHCSGWPYDSECTFLLSFEEWIHMKTPRKIGDEDLERLVDDVMTVEDFEDLLEVNI